MGKTLNDLRSKIDIDFLVCCVLRGDEAFIPSGNFTIKAGDTIGVTASEDDIASFFKEVGAYKQPIKNVIIVGGGRTTYYLESLLQKTKINSKVIERDKELCRRLSEQYSCTVICDNGSKQELLLAEGIEKADAFLALTSVDEENAIVSMFAKDMKVKKVITMISTLSYIDFFKSAGLDTFISPKSTMASYVLRYVRAMANTKDSEMESLHKLMDGKVEAVEFVVKGEIDGVTGVPIKDMKFRSGMLVVCIARKDKIIIPSGDDIIQPGDTVILVSNGGKMDSIKDIVKK